MARALQCMPRPLVDHLDMRQAAFSCLSPPRGSNMATDIQYLELTELTQRIHARELSAVEATQASLARIEALDRTLHSYALVLPEHALAQAKQAGRRYRPRRHQGSAARRADRGQGFVLDARRADRGGNHRASRLPAGGGRDGGEPAGGGRRGHPRQAATDGGRLRRPPPGYYPTGQSLERGALAGRVVQRLGLRDRRGALLRLARVGYRRLHPIPVLRRTG